MDAQGFAFRSSVTGTRLLRFSAMTRMWPLGCAWSCSTVAAVGKCRHPRIPFQASLHMPLGRLVDWPRALMPASLGAPQIPPLQRGLSVRGRDRHGIQHLGHALRGGKAAGTRRDAETGRPPTPCGPLQDADEDSGRVLGLLQYGPAPQSAFRACAPDAGPLTCELLDILPVQARRWD